MARQPTITTPAHKLSDAKLVLRMHRILDYFDTFAREAWCPGDMFTHWDWPTMRAYFPHLVDEYKRCVYEAKKRLVASAAKEGSGGYGTLNGVKYELTESGWREINTENMGDEE